MGDPGSGKTTLARFITQKVAINFNNKILQRNALTKNEQKENKSEERHSAEEKPVNTNNGETNGEEMDVESRGEDSVEGDEENEADEGNVDENEDENQHSEEDDESHTDAMQIDGESFDATESDQADAHSLPVNKKKYRKNPQEEMEDDLKTLESGPPKFPVLVRVSEFSEARAKEPELKLIDFLGFHSWLGMQYIKLIHVHL